MLLVNFSQEEWDSLIARFPLGTAVTGVVTSCQPFGVFVRVDEIPDVTALLEIIHFKVIESEPRHPIRFPDDYPAVGEPIEARILAWPVKPKDVRLTQLSHLDWSHQRWLTSQRT